MEQHMEKNISLDNATKGNIVTPLVTPEILAPAGDTNAVLAAFAAGADAVYLGLKHFSARMQAENFSVTELSRMVEMAHKEDRRIYVAMNTLLKSGDPASAANLISRLDRDVHPDALIVQDLGAVEMARQAGFSGEVHLSTLANVTHPAALPLAKELGVSRVILPRELNVDEVRLCNDACPDDMSLEMFVHGALCYCVSGRCWWSSYLGGKSGLRGRCVQPCRRVYQQKARKGRFFSCLDLSLDVLTKALLTMQYLKSWKIEGRKKGPHYVYHTVAAYKLLRDYPDDSKAKKQAADILAQALGRPSTHYSFLPQKPHAPVSPGEQTSSGLLAGKVQKEQATKKGGPRRNLGKGRPTGPANYLFKPRFPLQAGDFLRIGYEDEPWHFTMRVTRPVPKGGALHLKVPYRKDPKSGTAVFLIDRREPELMKQIKVWESKLSQCKGSTPSAVDFVPEMPIPAKRLRSMNIILRPSLPQGKSGKTGKFNNSVTGLWFSEKPVKTISKTLFSRISWWLPPVIWPNEEDYWKGLVRIALRKGARHFVLGSPWQAAFFEDAKVDLIAGPFCNPSNAAELEILRQMGFSGAIVAPELNSEDILALPRQSPLPLGIVLSGFWPVGISRAPLDGVKPGEPFTSPMKEVFWAKRYGQNTWIYPGWPLDIAEQKDALLDAGYSLFVTMTETPPMAVPEAKRISPFNWDIPLL